MITRIRHIDVYMATPKDHPWKKFFSVEYRTPDGEWRRMRATEDEILAGIRKEFPGHSIQVHLRTRKRT